MKNNSLSFPQYNSFFASQNLQSQNKVHLDNSKDFETSRKSYNINSSKRRVIFFSQEGSEGRLIRFFFLYNIPNTQ